MSKTGTIIDWEEAKVEGKFTMEGGGWILLRLLSNDERKEILKKCQKKEIVFLKVEGTPHKDVTETFDHELWGSLFYDAVIVGWGNFIDKHKKEIPFATETIPLMLKAKNFNKFVAESYQALEKQAEKDRENEGGN